jgi:hypothetical protein
VDSEFITTSSFHARVNPNEPFLGYGKNPELSSAVARIKKVE